MGGIIFMTFYTASCRVYIALLLEIQRVCHSVSLYTRMEDASAYIQFILRSIQSRDLFHSIRIEPTCSWEYLLWMDQVSFHDYMYIYC